MSDDELRAELYATQRECADLWDALVDARDVIDAALSKARRQDQARAWAGAAAAVNAAAGQKPQRQDALLDQLRDLVAVANREGMYDAADHLRRMIEDTPAWMARRG